MFTGLVETIGTVSSTSNLTQDATANATLTISDCPTILTDAHLGDSISVNGTCLTITAFDATSFTVGVAPETLRRTTLGRLTRGARCNLERAVRADTRMGGHFVQGHVDTVAHISRRTPDGEAVTFRLVPRGGRAVLRYVVEKGYVTLDGASLTITAVNDAEEWFEVMLISYTQERVVMASKGVGEEVNVEIDVVGKMVEKSVEGYLEEKQIGNEVGGPSVLEKMIGRIVEEKLLDALQSRN